jgi:hypothetical protein
VFDIAIAVLELLECPEQIGQIFLDGSNGEQKIGTSPGIPCNCIIFFSFIEGPENVIGTIVYYIDF